MTRAADKALALAAELRQIAGGKNSEQQVGLTCAGALDIASCLESLARSRPLARAKKRKGLTSRSKLNRRQNSDYFEFIRGHECCNPDCGSRVNVQVSHFGRSGMGQKASDEQTVPLCSRCHLGEWHQHGHLPGMTRAESLDLFKRVAADLLEEWAALQDPEML